MLSEASADFLFVFGPEFNAAAIAFVFREQPFVVVLVDVFFENLDFIRSIRQRYPETE